MDCATRIIRYESPEPAAEMNAEDISVCCSLYLKKIVFSTVGCFVWGALPRNRAVCQRARLQTAATPRPPCLRLFPHLFSFFFLCSSSSASSSPFPLWQRGARHVGVVLISAIAPSIARSIPRRLPFLVAPLRKVFVPGPFGMTPFTPRFHLDSGPQNALDLGAPFPHPTPSISHWMNR